MGGWGGRECWDCGGGCVPSWTLLVERRNRSRIPTAASPRSSLSWVIFLFFIFVLFYFFRGVVPAHHGAHGSQCSSTAASAVACDAGSWQGEGPSKRKREGGGRRGEEATKIKFHSAINCFCRFLFQKYLFTFIFKQELFIHLFIFVCSSSIAAIKASPE